MSLTYIEKARGGVKVFAPKTRLGTIFKLADGTFQFRKKGDAHLNNGPKFGSVTEAKLWLDETYGDNER